MFSNKQPIINFYIFRLLYCLLVAYEATNRTFFFWKTRDSGIFKGFVLQNIFPNFEISTFYIYFFSLILIASLTFTALGVYPRIMSLISVAFYFNNFYLTELEFMSYDNNVVFFNLIAFSFFPKESSIQLVKFKQISYAKEWPLNIIKLNLTLAYFAAFISKIRLGGWDWVNGETLRFYLYERYLMTGNVFAEFATQFPWICTLFALTTLIGEAFFGLVFHPNIWVRRLTIFTGIMLHFGVFIFMSINFKLFIISYLVFIPYNKVIGKLLNLKLQIRRS